jgi:putative addiction module component (TIGR02574 family)
MVTLRVKAMTNEAKNLEGEALKLPPNDRAWLAERLLSSLDAPPTYSAEEIEAAWLEESSRRFEAYRSGKMGGQPAQEAIADLLAERD